LSQRFGVVQGYDPARMGHMSNRERIARAAAEAQAKAAEKAEKKATKPVARGRPKSGAKAVRMKIVWEACNANGTAVKTFPYPDKAAAEALVEELTKKTGRAHVLRASKVPME